MRSQEEDTCVRRFGSLAEWESHLGMLSYVRVIIEVDRQERAACVADTLSLYVPASGGDTGGGNTTA
jgi:hypothetical protein